MLPEEISLLRVTIRHGRTHQIRVHMAYAGHPLIGDPVYGCEDGESGGKVTLLHASSVRFRHPYRDEEISVQAPGPAWVTAISRTGESDPAHGWGPAKDSRKKEKKHGRRE